VNNYRERIWSSFYDCEAGIIFGFLIAQRPTHIAAWATGNLVLRAIRETKSFTIEPVPQTAPASGIGEWPATAVPRIIVTEDKSPRRGDAPSLDAN
jgi:hypothetical protein